MSRRELARRVGDFSQVFGVELLSHGDGISRGVRVLRFTTGSGLAFELLVDRCLDLAGMTYRGVPIGWHSQAGFRAPWLHEHDAEDGLGWARSFSGMMNTCGLDHIHAPEVDSAAHFHYGLRRRVAHGLHGRIAFTPARLTGYGEHWDGERCLLYAEGEVRQAAMFAENLLLRRRVEVEVGSDRVTISDRVSNLGFDPTPHLILYHVNLGWPLVDAGTRLVAPIEDTPFTAHDPAATDVGPIEQSEPRAGFVEQVYEHRLTADPEGFGRAALVNEAFALASADKGGARGLALEVAFEMSSLPAFFQWQNFQEGQYVVALEPASAHAGRREDWRRRGEMRILDHGEAVDYRLELTPHAGEADLAALRRRLA